jgi:nitrous oxidase accessory protein NosD
VTVGGLEITGAVGGSGDTSGVEVVTGADCVISGNLIHGNFNGVLVRGHATITGNEIRQNTWGIHAVTSGVVTVTENDVIQNGVPVSVTVWAAGSAVYHNNFIDNGNQWTNDSPAGIARWQDGYTHGGNFWSHWTGPDDNGDGLVDVPLGRDYYPVAVENGWRYLSEETLERSIHNTTSGSDHHTIAGALQAASAGDLIVLDGGDFPGRGLYYENVEVLTPVTLVSHDGAVLTSPIWGTSVITIRSAGVSVSGLEVTGAVGGSGDTSGVEVVPGADCVISGNLIRGNFNGVFVRGHATITGNEIRQNTWGIHAVTTGVVTVTENDVIQNGVPVSVTVGNAAGSAVYHNNFIDNGNQWTNESPAGIAIWDLGYPDGGNFWSHWTGPDDYSGEGQDLEGADGIVDLPMGSDAYPFAAVNGWPPSNQPPVADAGPDLTEFPHAVYPGEVFVLDATGSYDPDHPDGFIVEYEWSFDDLAVHVDSIGGSTDGVFDGMTTFAFGEPDLVHVVVLTVMDDDGAVDEDEVAVRVLSTLGGVAGIIDLVLGYGLTRGAETAVLAKLNAAAVALAKGNHASARAALEDLLDQLSAPGFCAHRVPPGFCDHVSAEVNRLLSVVDA